MSEWWFLRSPYFLVMFTVALILAALDQGFLAVGFGYWAGCYVGEGPQP